MKLANRFDPSRFPLPSVTRSGPALAWGVALAVTAWVAADLFWRLSAPRPPALPVASHSDPRVAAQAVSSRHLMGDTVQGAVAGPLNTAPTRFALQAVVTGSGGRPGWAILSIDGGPQQGIVEGQEIQPGMRLERVQSNSIEIGTGGLRQTVKLAERGNGSATATTALPASVTQLPPLVQGSPTTDNTAEAPDSGPRPLPAGFAAQPVPSQ